jgi:hypothetical protein
VTAAAASCDTGKRDEQKTLGPAVLIVGVSVGDGRPMPADGAIQVAFDRYLLPATVNRQAIVIVDGANQPLPPQLAPIVLYDPIARTVTLAPPMQPWLTEGQPYKLIVGIPEGDADTGGIRAIDRATLFADQKRDFAFFVGPKRNVPIEPTASFCRDVLPIFTAKCSLPTCHGGANTAAASLLLDTSAGVGATALNRVAQGANRGPSAGLGTTSERKFGIDMPIIAPGSPGNSWLMYKIDLARLPVAPGAPPQYACTNGLLEPAVSFAFTPLAPNAQRSADEIERSILSNYILGREMPFPVAGSSAYEDLPLTFEEREKVRLWIQSLLPGSSVPECGGCGIIPSGDAGSNEGGAIDAGGADAADAGIADAADQ